jgi:serine/threonine-protein kinase
MIGRTISHYKILEKIGAGGMGEVYKAEDIRLGRTVALKFLPTELSRDSQANRRFMREARAASSLDHPNICGIHEVDTGPNGRFFICMNYCEGESLKDVIDRGPMSNREAVKVAVKVADGLAAAHRAGVVHRDIKPANIIVTGEGGVKIIDFGLAKLSGASRVTRSGITVGTIAYKSPEQTRSEDVDGRTDIWSLGLVLFEMLTGQHAFAADFEQATMYSIMNEKPRRVSDLRSNVPKQLERIVNRCLEKNPADRYQTARELVDDLDKLAENYGWSSVTSEGRTPRGRRQKRRMAFSLSAGALVIAAVVVVVAGWDALTKRAEGDIPGEQHLAVLRFVNVGAEESFDAFSDGLVETITSKLTQLEQFQGTLWVVPASEIRQRDIKSVSEARDAFNVNLVVTGSVQRAGGGFLMTMNLVDTRTERQLKSTIIDDPMMDTSVLQDETVVRLAEMLNLELRPETRQVLAAGGTLVPDAYQIYIEGRGYLQQHAQEKNIDHAIELFGRAIERDSLYALAYAGLGEAYWRKYEACGDTSMVVPAKSNCRRAVEINDLLAPVHVTLGIIDRGTGHFDEAITEFQKALQLDPANYEAHLELAIVYQELDWVEEAEETYRKAIALRPDYWAGFTNLGYFYYRNGRLEEAVEHFVKATELTPENDPDNMRAYNSLIGLYYFLGDVQRSREMYEKSKGIEPNADASSNMATVYIFEKQYAQAIPLLEEAITLGENKREIWGNLGDAYRYTPGMDNEATASYLRAIEIAKEQLAVNPKKARLRANMAVHCAKARDIDAALENIELAKGQAPDDVAVLFDSVIVYELAGRREDALRVLQRTIDGGGYLEEIRNDPELEELRETDEYRRMITQ